MEALQLSFAVLLQRYLRHRLGEGAARAKLAQALELIALSREAYDMHSKMICY